MSKSPIGRSFSELVQDRAAREASFVAALLGEAVDCLLAGDVSTAKALVRDTIRGAIGYAELSRRTAIPEKSLVRMFGPSGNPTAANIANVLLELQTHSRIRLRVRSEPAEGRRSRQPSARRTPRVA